MKPIGMTGMLILLMAPLLSLANDEVALTKPGWFKRVFTRLSWDEIQSIVESPREASAAVRHNVRYAEDLGDTWTSGKDTWDRGFGDCEDLAAAVVEMVHHAGGEASIVLLHPENSGACHAIAAGTWKGRPWISSNGFYYSVKSLDHAKELVAREMGWRFRTIVAEPADSPGAISMVSASQLASATRILLPGALPWK